MLSMIETASRITNNNLNPNILQKIIVLGKEMLEKPIELLDGVEEVLQQLQGKYKLVVATKGDLLDQERKLKKSGIEHYFHHIEIMSDKQEADFAKLIKHLDIQPNEFLILGNSLISDVLPVLAIGGHGVHIPFHITWEHEKTDVQIDDPNFKQLKNIKDILSYLL